MLFATHRKYFCSKEKIVKFKLINRSPDIDLEPESLSICRAKAESKQMRDYMISKKYLEDLTRGLRRRTECSMDLFGIKPIEYSEAEKVVKIAMKIADQLPFLDMNEQLENELICQTLRSRGHEEYANIYSMVGIPVENLINTITGNGFESKENANLQNNAETSHKKGADDLFKKFYLKLLPIKIKEMHENGDLHIHDLEYFGTRPFCQDWDLRYFFYYGLMPDGNGNKASVSGPAMHPEVAVLHAVKALGSAQTNFAGGQGYYNFLTFLAPYFNKLPYPKIKQLMQMFVFEMTQMMVARGGQLVFSSVQLSPGVPKLWVDRPVVAFGKCFDGKKDTRWEYGELEPEVRLMFMALMEVLLEGDYWGKPFNFPKPEVVLDKEFVDNLDQECICTTEDYKVEKIPTFRELYSKAFELAANTGSPYFDNCIPDYRNMKGEGISCYQCISQDTLVPVKTAKGIELIYAEEMTENSEFLTPEGVKKAACITSYNVDKTLLIKTKGGRKIECSPDHTLLAIKNKTQERLKANQLSKGDALVCSDELPENGAMSVEMAYFLGLYTSEGNILIRDINTGGHRVQFSFSANEKDLAKRTDNLLRDLFGVDPSTGINCHVPPAIFELPKLQKMAFLQGVLHGDGSIGKTIPKIGWQFRSEKLAAGLAMLLRSIGYHPILGRIANKNMYFLNLTRKEEVKSFLAGEILPINIEPAIIKDIREIEGRTKVYDPVDIDGHTFILSSGIVSGNCCSYRFSTSLEADPDFVDKLNFKDGAHFSMGSFQVVTLNIPRIAYKSKDLNECIESIKKMMKESMQIFYAKAYWMNKMRENNRMPFICQRPHDPGCKTIKGPEAADLSKLTYTFGIVGLEEAVQSLSGQKMEDSIEAWEMGLAIVSEMESYLTDLEKESGFTLAIARTPAETVAGRFAALDLMNVDIVFQAMDVIKGDVPGCLAKIHTLEDKSTDQPVYYTNGTHIPVSADIPLGKKAEREGAFFPILSGGNIMHIFLGEETPNPEALMNFAFKLAKETPVGYFCFTRDFTICLECDRISAGLKNECPLCRSNNVDHISRVTGYNSAVSGWNKAKQQELKDRMRYNL